MYGAGNDGAGTGFAFANAALPFYLAGYGFPNFAIGLVVQDHPPLAGLSEIIVLGLGTGGLVPRLTRFAVNELGTDGAPRLSA
jgi:hypothetical protein